MKRKRIIFGILIVLNCITIFYFSHQIATSSSEQSGRIVEIILNILPNLDKQIITIIIRKTAHFSIYGLLGILTANFISTIETKKTSKILIYSLLFCVIYSITDEFHQSFIPGRSAELRDVLIDNLGAATGIMILIVLKKLLEKIKSNKN